MLTEISSFITIYEFVAKKLKSSRATSVAFELRGDLKNFKSLSDVVRRLNECEDEFVKIAAKLTYSGLINVRKEQEKPYFNRSGGSGWAKSLHHYITGVVYEAFKTYHEDIKFSKSNDSIFAPFTHRYLAFRFILPIRSLIDPTSKLLLCNRPNNIVEKLVVVDLKWGVVPKKKRSIYFKGERIKCTLPNFHGHFSGGRIITAENFVKLSSLVTHDVVEHIRLGRVRRNQRTQILGDSQNP